MLDRLERTDLQEAEALFTKRSGKHAQEKNAAEPYKQNSAPQQEAWTKPRILLAAYQQGLADIFCSVSFAMPRQRFLICFRYLL
jgi:hypothetical protein